MDPDRWDRVRTIYHAALDKDPEERASFLEEVCGDDRALHQEVGSLLAEGSAASFLEQPAWQPAPPVEQQKAPGDPVALNHVVEALPARTTAGARHPFLWVVWSVLAGLVAAFGYAGWKLTQDWPSFGWSERTSGSSKVVSAVNPSGPAAARLRAGDILVCLNGDGNVARVGTGLYRTWLHIGESYRLCVRREDQVLERTLTVGRAAPNRGSMIFWYFQSLTWCAIGLFIGFARPQDVVARLAFAAATLTGFVYLQLDFLPSLAALQPLHGILGYHFFYRFPGEPPCRKGWRILLWMLYVFGVPAGLYGTIIKGSAFVSGPQAATAWLSIPLAQAILPAVLSGVFGMAMVGAVAVAIHKYRQVADAGQRRRFHWVALGGVLGLAPEIPYAVVYIARSNPAVAAWLFPGESWVWFSNVMVGLSVAVPLGVAYSVVKHRVFDVKVAIRRGLQYAFAQRFLQALLALPSGVLVYALVTQRHRSIEEVAAGASGTLFWIIALVLSLRFRAPLLRWLDTRFFRDHYDSGQVVFGAMQELAKLDSVDEISGVVCRRLGAALHPKAIELWWHRNGTMTLVQRKAPAAEPARFPFSDSSFEGLVRRGPMVCITTPADPALRSVERACLEDKGVRLIVPVPGKEGAEGVLLLGEKESEESYCSADEQLITAIVQQCTVVLDNLRLKEKMRDEHRIRVEVLSKLDPSLVNLMKQCPDCGACYEGAAERCERDGTELSIAAPVARTIAGRYRLDQLVGRGGMGVVYQARDLRLGREVAVKVMLSGAFGEPAALRRFQREGQAVARLNHPNIVAMYDCGELEGGGAYLVMERVHGLTMREELRRNGVLPPFAAAEWFDQILDGLTAAHRLGVVHRDLKPENVFGTRSESGDLHVKLIDFGLAKILPVSSSSESMQSLTGSGVVVGTLAYMAPEQLARQEVGAEADVYAAGVMLVEAITGARPRFDGLGVCPGGHRQGVSPIDGPLSAVIQRCLALAPTDRFASAAELRDALIPALRASLARFPEA